MAFHNAAHHSAAHTFHYGDPGDHAILGDWNGDGCDGYGLYRPSAGSFFLSNDMNTTMDHDGFLFGPLGATPMTGEFDGNGTDQVAVYLGPTLYLGSGAPNGAANPAVITTFDYGAPGDRYLFGDWSGNGTDTVGSYRPSNGTIYLRDSNSAGAADYDFFIGTFEVVVSGRE